MYSCTCGAVASGSIIHQMYCDQRVAQIVRGDRFAIKDEVIELIADAANPAISENAGYVIAALAEAEWLGFDTQARRIVGEQIPAVILPDSNALVRYIGKVLPV